jgi:hypothetical protein
MSWWTLINAMENGPGRNLLIKAAEQNPEIYLYAGSANDLTPLLLGIDDSIFGRRLYQPDQNADKPLLLWMSEWSVQRPISAYFESQPYADLWERLGSTFEVTSFNPVNFVLNDDVRTSCLKTWIFDVLVTSTGGRRNQYRILLTEGDCKSLIDFMSHHQLRLSWLAMIRVGGFCGGPTGELVRRAPKAIMENSRNLGGLPEALIWDRNGWLPDGFRYRRIHGHEVRDWGWGWVAFHCRPDLYERYEALDLVQNADEGVGDEEFAPQKRQAAPDYRNQIRLGFGSITEAAQENILDWHALGYADTGCTLLRRFATFHDTTFDILERFLTRVNDWNEPGSLYPVAPISAIPRSSMQPDNELSLRRNIEEYFDANRNIIHAKRILIDLTGHTDPNVPLKIIRDLIIEEEKLISPIREILVQV